jgi:hypothetical protein
VALEVIGAGFGRTGTLSMKAAFEQLGHRPCYHFVEVMEPRPGYNDGHRDAWVAFMKGRAEMDWQWLYRSYAATLDLPMCLYYRELMEVFPAAKVVLTVRDPDSWFDSYFKMARMMRRMRPFNWMSPKLLATARIADEVNDRIFGGPPIDRKVAIAAFERHNQAVIDYVPRERLLVFDVREGWEPLCDFLECPVPEVPFPRLNEGEALSWRMVQTHIFQRKNVFSTDHLQE